MSVGCTRHGTLLEGKFEKITEEGMLEAGGLEMIGTEEGMLRLLERGRLEVEDTKDTDEIADIEVMTTGMEEVDEADGDGGIDIIEDGTDSKEEVTGRRVETEVDTLTEEDGTAIDETEDTMLDVATVV